jgi:hypothetical protein
LKIRKYSRYKECSKKNNKHLLNGRGIRREYEGEGTNIENNKVSMK